MSKKGYLVVAMIFAIVITGLIIFGGCGAASDNACDGAAPGDSEYSLEINFSDEICFSYIFPNEFNLWGTFSGEGYKNLSYLYATINGGSVFFTIVQNHFIAFITNVTTGQNTISIDWSFNDSSRVYSTNITITVNTNIPILKFTKPTIYTITNTNSVQIIGTLTPTNNITNILMKLNNSGNTNYSPAPVWTNIYKNIPDGLNTLHAVIWTTNSNSMVNALAAILVIIDTTLPNVDSVSPTPGANDVGLTNKVKLVFSEDIQSGNIANLVQIQKVGSPIAANYSYDSNTYTLLISPTTSLQDGTTYNIFVSNGICDIAGNSLMSNENYSFSTFLPPTVNNAAFSGTTKLIISYPESGVMDLRTHSPRLQWVTSSYNYDNVYKYYAIIMNDVPVIQGTTIVNTEDAVAYWSSDSGTGANGNIDMLRDSFQIISGTPTSVTNSDFVNDQIYYVVLYGVNSQYTVAYSAPILIFRW